MRKLGSVLLIISNLVGNLACAIGAYYAAGNYYGWNAKTISGAIGGHVAVPAQVRAPLTPAVLLIVIGLALLVPSWIMLVRDLRLRSVTTGFDDSHKGRVVLSEPITENPRSLADDFALARSVYVSSITMGFERLLEDGVPSLTIDAFTGALNPISVDIHVEGVIRLFGEMQIKHPTKIYCWQLPLKSIHPLRGSNTSPGARHFRFD